MALRMRRSIILLVKALFATLTNVNFDAARFEGFIKRCTELREILREKVGKAVERWILHILQHPLKRQGTLEELIKQGEDTGYPWDSEGGGYPLAPADIVIWH